MRAAAADLPARCELALVVLAYARICALGAALKGAALLLALVEVEGVCVELVGGRTQPSRGAI
jgi:hypothetical protein